MLTAAPQRLRPAGSLYCECGPRNAYELAALARSAFQNGRVEIREDLSGKPRFVCISLRDAERA
jgi:methylase of polypeptide subunit release factors